MKYFSIAAGIFGMELWIKNRVEKHYTNDTQKLILWGKIRLRKYHNQGACLNLLEKKQPVVATLSVLLTVGTLILFVISLGQKGNALQKAGLSLLLGGAFSNTYDRISKKYVVDYFSFRTGLTALDKVVFNLADFAIIIGAMAAALAAPAR